MGNRADVSRNDSHQSREAPKGRFDSLRHTAVRGCKIQRMALPEEHQAKWLGEVEDGDMKELLNPFPADQMKMWPISPRVNSPKNDDPGILTPIGA